MSPALLTIVLSFPFFLIFFAIQLLCCLKVSKPTRKPVPLYVILLVFLFALLLYLGVFGQGDGGVAIHAIFASIIAFCAAAALLGDGSAWFVYWLKRRICKK